jgi:hypothetical protein
MCTFFKINNSGTLSFLQRAFEIVKRMIVISKISVNEKEEEEEVQNI